MENKCHNCVVPAAGEDIEASRTCNAGIVSRNRIANSDKSFALLEAKRGITYCVVVGKLGSVVFINKIVTDWFDRSVKDEWIIEITSTTAPNSMRSTKCSAGLMSNSSQMQ